MQFIGQSNGKDGRAGKLKIFAFLFITELLVFYRTKAFQGYFCIIGYLVKKQCCHLGQ